MSVIIKGLNLPKEELNQERLSITIWADGCVTNEGDGHRNEDGTYRKEYWNYEQFSAIELPPHGKLIDAGAFASEMKKRQEEAGKRLREAKDRETAVRADAVLSFLCEVKLTLDAAPTIIETE